MPFDHTKLDKEEEQKRLELEMQKRRERIERWRAERKKKELEATKKDGKVSIVANLQLPTKKWSLEDDSDEETPLLPHIGILKEIKEEESSSVVLDEIEEVKDDVEEIKEKPVELEDDVDPLDAFMAEVSFLMI